MEELDHQCACHGKEYVFNVGETFDKETINVVMSSAETEHRHWWKLSHVTFNANNTVSHVFILHYVIV